jgi:hypothetical protein
LNIEPSKPKRDFANRDTVSKPNPNLSSGLEDPAGMQQVPIDLYSWILQNQVGFTIQRTYHKYSKECNFTVSIPDEMEWNKVKRMRGVILCVEC